MLVPKVCPLNHPQQRHARGVEDERDEPRHGEPRHDERGHEGEDEHGVRSHEAALGDQLRGVLGAHEAQGAPQRDALQQDAPQQDAHGVLDEPRQGAQESVVRAKA